MITSCWLTNNISCSAMWRCAYGLSPYQLEICQWPVSIPTTDMSLFCPRTNYRCLWRVSVPATDVTDLSPYQLQICQWPVSIPTTDMSMMCLRTSYRCHWSVLLPTTDMFMTRLRTSYRYVSDLSPYQSPHTSFRWPITHCHKHPKTIFMYVRHVLTAPPKNSCILF